jgi:hypothetical protein
VDFKVLVTNFDSRLRHSFTMLDKIKATFKNQMFSTIIHVNVKLKEAQNEGTHILNYDKYCRGTKDYFSLSREMITADSKGEPVVVAEKSRSSAPAKEPKMETLSKRMETILKEELPKIKLNEVELTLQAPDASRVYVAGDFNGWKTDDTTLMVQDNGVWKKRVSLTAGSYRYKFVKDGEWIEDPANPKVATNPYGQKDSLIEV